MEVSYELGQDVVPQLMGFVPWTSFARIVRLARLARPVAAYPVQRPGVRQDAGVSDYFP